MGLVCTNRAGIANLRVVFLPGIKSFLLCYQTLQMLHIRTAGLFFLIRTLSREGHSRIKNAISGS